MLTSTSFRAWDTYENKFIPNLDIDSIKSDNDIHRFIIQRYTGFVDKNGKPIYQGDIIKLVKEFMLCFPYTSRTVCWNSLFKYYYVRSDSNGNLSHKLQDIVKKGCIVVNNILKHPN